MTRIIAVAVVVGCADDDRVTNSIHRHRLAGLIACGFAVDIGTDLHPHTASQRQHPGMTRIIAVAVVERAPMMTVSPTAFIATDKPDSIACGFAVDIGTDLHPHTVSQREHPSMTRTSPLPSLKRAPMMTVSPTAFIATDQPDSIVCGFAVDIGTDLHPHPVSQREHPSMTRIMPLPSL